jgi:hypothetical protein
MQMDPLAVSTLAGIDVPTKELHDRFLAGGLTKYDYGTIVAALKEMDELVEEECQLLAQAADLIRPHDQYMGDIAYAPEHIQKLDALTRSDITPIFQTGNTRHGGRQEKWPVDKWQKQMATYRRANSNLRKALEACHL